MIQFINTISKIHFIDDIYIFFIYEFSNWKWFQSIDELFSTIRFLSRIRHVIPFHTDTHTHTHPIVDQEENCFHFPSMFLAATFLRNLTHPAFRGKWREWKRRKKGRERHREREKNRDRVFFFLVPGESRARDWNIAQVVLCYGNGELTVTWIEENSIALTDEPEGRCFSWGKMEKSME